MLEIKHRSYSNLKFLSVVCDYHFHCLIVVVDEVLEMSIPIWLLHNIEYVGTT